MAGGVDLVVIDGRCVGAPTRATPLYSTGGRPGMRAYDIQAERTEKKPEFG
jgi:hypothetical protein